MSGEAMYEVDVRHLAAERLAYVGALQARERRRDAVNNVPWTDIRQGQGRVLALLKLKPEITQRDMTFLMGMSRQSLAELLSKLERQGLIEREPSPTDRRVAVIRLTQAGRDAEQNWQYGEGDPIVECLDDDQVATLADLLGRIIEHYEQLAGDDERRQLLRDVLADQPGQPGQPGPSFPGPGFPGFFGPPGPAPVRAHGPHGPIPPDPRFGPPGPPPPDPRFGPPAPPTPPDPRFGPPAPPDPRLGPGPVLPIPPDPEFGPGPMPAPVPPDPQFGPIPPDPGFGPVPVMGDPAIGGTPSPIMTDPNFGSDRPRTWDLL